MAARGSVICSVRLPAAKNRVPASFNANQRLMVLIPSSPTLREEMYKTPALHDPPDPLKSLQFMQLRKAILKLHWLGHEDQADTLMLDLATHGPSEIFPMEPLETD